MSAAPNRLAWIAWVVALSLALPSVACSSSSSTGAPVDGGSTVTKSHRATSVTCTHDRGPGSVDASCKMDGGISTTACDIDAECTTSNNGRCYTNVGGIRCPGNVCSYDACFGDSDCPGNLPCECRSPYAHNANYCVTGSECRVDADCGTGGLCAASGVSNCQLGYFCRTANDTCAADSDCAGQSAGTTCSYDTQAKRWRCGPSTCLPVP